MAGGGKKRWLFFKRMKKGSWSLRWKYLGSAFKFRPLNLQLSFYDDVVFKIVAAFEASIFKEDVKMYISVITTTKKSD
ncbi:unnamed protein product [Malus baccata var. baccata]